MGFMFGGIGLMLIAPALAIYYVEDLKLSYSSISIARYVFMGFGIILSTYFWKNALLKISFSKLLIFILSGFSFFSFFLLFAKTNILFLNLAFFVYGVSQAGSHLLWNLSGTIFSKNQPSISFTSINILMVGIRGAVFPFIGGMLCLFFKPQGILLLGIIMCMSGAIYMYKTRKEFGEIKNN